MKNSYKNATVNINSSPEKKDYLCTRKNKELQALKMLEVPAPENQGCPVYKNIKYY